MSDLIWYEAAKKEFAKALQQLNEVENVIAWEGNDPCENIVEFKVIFDKAFERELEGKIKEIATQIYKGSSFNAFALFEDGTLYIYEEVAHSDIGGELLFEVKYSETTAF